VRGFASFFPSGGGLRFGGGGGGAEGMPYKKNAEQRSFPFLPVGPGLASAT
jgi:hypothetical protein